MNQDEPAVAPSDPIAGAYPPIEIRRGVARWWMREITGVLFVAAMLFIPAGTLTWGWGWALVGIYAGWVATNGLILGARNPELMVERATRPAGGKRWDMLIMSIVGLATLAKYILAGLDYRYGWTTGITPAWQITAMVIAALGYALGTWVMAVNAYFSLLVRIQEDRGHAVVSDGPYRILRHPGYLGTIAFELATPVMLGSWWALIPGALAALLFVVRTALEDRDLSAELPGYKEYTQRVRYRLLPGVW